MYNEIRQYTDYAYHGYYNCDGEHHNKIHNKMEGMRISFSWFTNHIYIDYFKDNEQVDIFGQFHFSNKKVGNIEIYEYYL